MDSTDCFRPQRTGDPSVFGLSVSTTREGGGDGTATLLEPAAWFDRSLAVVIGINTYGEGLAQLRSAIPDARAVAEALQRDHGFETWCLFDEDARLSQLLGLLHGKLPSALRPEDRLLFYFAGHGVALDSDRALHESDYVAMGSVARVLPQRATAVHDQLVAEDAAYAVTIRNVFTRMVSVVGGDVARRRVPRNELAYDDPAENQRVAEVLQRFHHARLISLGRDERGDRATSAYAEPTHDELVRGWTKMSQWLDELDASIGLRALVSLSDAVRSWNDHGQRDSYLWSDPRLGLLHERAREQPFLLNADEARFVNRSAQRQRRRRARVIGGLLAAIVVLAVLAVVALWEQQRALDEAKRATENEQRATTQEKLATENANRAMAQEKLATENGQRAMAEARRATERASNARHRLAQLYEELGRQLVVEKHYQEAMPYLLEARRNGEATAPLRMMFWAASRHLPLVPALEHQGQVVSAAFSPDGTRVVTASWDKTARIWDAATGKPLTSPLEHQDIVVSAAFSPDGTRIVTVSEDKTARIWDATTGKPSPAPSSTRMQS